MILIYLTLLSLSASIVNCEYEHFFESYPDHEIEIDDSDIDPSIFFNLKSIDLRKPETYGVFMEPKMKYFSDGSGKFIENPFIDYYADKEKFDDEQSLIPSDDVKPVVEKQIERYAEDAPAQAISYERRHTSDGVQSSVTHHGKNKKYLAPKFSNSGSFSYQGRKFSYKLNKDI